jgi:rRNA maturation protein Nop10
MGLILQNNMLSSRYKEELCMKGGIYTDQHCAVCGGVQCD